MSPTGRRRIIRRRGQSRSNCEARARIGHHLLQSAHRRRRALPLRAAERGAVVRIERVGTGRRGSKHATGAHRAMPLSLRGRPPPARGRHRWQHRPTEADGAGPGEVRRCACARSLGGDVRRPRDGGGRLEGLDTAAGTPRIFVVFCRDFRTRKSTFSPRLRAGAPADEKQRGWCWRASERKVFVSWRFQGLLAHAREPGRRIRRELRRA